MLPALYLMVLKAQESTPGTVEVDGHVARGIDLGWIDIHDGVGTYASGSDLALTAYVRTYYNPNKWRGIQRTIHLFDTTAILANWHLVKVTLSIYGTGSYDDIPMSPTLNVFEVNPANLDKVVMADYDKFEAYPLSNYPHTIASYNTSGFNDFVLNAAGRSRIVKGGITPLGLREATADAPNIEPVWSDSNASGFDWVSSFDSDSSKHAYLTIVYTK